MSQSDQGAILFELPASKSLSNRALIIKALGEQNSIRISNLSAAKDTVTLIQLLEQAEPGATLDCGPAGTTFRFLCAWLCTREGSYTLTGSKRMQERPIGVLVDALKSLGAWIEYLNQEGFPPLRINGFGLSSDQGLAHRPEVVINPGISSQFLSAILLIAPVLPKGLLLRWEGRLVSKPYLDMTIGLMKHFGAQIELRKGSESNEQEPDRVEVATGGYKDGSYHVESDWSAASYFIAGLALRPAGTQMFIKGLKSDSLQGDRRQLDWFEEWGITTQFQSDGFFLIRNEERSPSHFEADFDACPDLAQTFSVLCAASGTTAIFSGLETLKVKETDRIAALKTELAKVGVHLSKLPAHFWPSKTGEVYMQEGKAAWEGELSISTYHDHRMAMAFALLDQIGRLRFEDPTVVEKSFPSFWTEWAKWTA